MAFTQVIGLSSHSSEFTIAIVLNLLSWTTVKAMLTHQYVYAYGAVSIPQGNFDSLVLPAVNSGCMAIFLAEISSVIRTTLL